MTNLARASPPEDPFDRLVAELEQRFADNLDEAFRRAVSAIDLDVLAAAIDGDDSPATFEALSIEDNQATALRAALDDGFLGAMSAAMLASGTALGRRYSFGLDQSHAELSSLRDQLRNEVIAPLAREAAQTALETIRRQRQRGLDGTRIARAVVQSFDLSPRQADSLDAFRAVFEEVLNSPLRARLKVGDQTRIPQSVVDHAIRRRQGNLNAAQRSVLKKTLGTEPDEDAVEKAVARQARALGEFRRTAIARQEAVRAANAGEYAAFVQGRQNGKIPADRRRFWVTAGDERVRHSHRMVPSMNDDGVDIGEPFRTPFGSVMFPPLEINCRCRVRIDAAR